MARRSTRRSTEVFGAACFRVAAGPFSGPVAGPRLRFLRMCFAARPGWSRMPWPNRPIDLVEDLVRCPCVVCGVRWPRRPWRLRSAGSADVRRGPSRRRPRCRLRCPATFLLLLRLRAFRNPARPLPGRVPARRLLLPPFRRLRLPKLRPVARRPLLPSRGPP